MSIIRSGTSRCVRSSWLALLLMVGAILYMSWILAPIIAPDGIDPVRSYASELAADDQQGSTFFRAADLMAGTSVALAGGVTALNRRRSRWVTTGWWALALFGLSTVIDSGAPLSCAPTVDEQCAAREAAGDVPWLHLVHTGSSVSASVALLVAVVMLTPIVVPRLRRWSQIAGTILVAAAAGYLVATGWAMMEISRASIEWPWPSLLGIAQRTQLTCASAWLATLSVALWHGRAGSVAPLARRPIAREVDA
ncbi:hypothetical protein KEM60_00266 [Austwickia sp. TVS 96-490-7B]|uniref:DUF998 domain-containing protein n=1 Tax=Austwickia sp. TVS 96-490-7B TaxID=2830843 RepID=UPI001C590991|nr:DUF998 domain-containing protein [Austwickia sp. TVS 96-490-7B]MBW3084083.1 hypothetical protein [Austwickia sp. TVS 96-490-7B]